MIPKHKIDEIMQTVPIEEVISEFVHLKKAGASYKGLSPWNNEKTPSFVVSPAKGIFKDFSSGKGGNVVTFIMEHEHFTYPEALRWLAKRYNIELEEEAPNPEAEQARNERESLYIINEFAQKWFVKNLWEVEEGQNIGLSYFKERGFHESIIKKFGLGYSLDSFEAFTTEAREAGYEQDYLLTLGLIKEKNGKYYDGYRGRVMFPIHNLSGRVIGFGGRTLLADKKVPKYINSPENAVYDKSGSLYGLYFAKSGIGKADNCFLVEGYTDVLAFHQKHIENTVSSSGTALTSGQIRLIKRYTSNITLVYDGDPAGIKASLRGIDLILEEGMNAKIVLLPDGHDPDSFSKEHDRIEVEEFLKDNAKDFIRFKAEMLMKEANGDPIKLNAVVHDIVGSISKIPDTILRSIYLNECSKLLDVSEKALISELNKLLRKNHQRQVRNYGNEVVPEAPVIEADFTEKKQFDEDTLEPQEFDLLRLIANYGTHQFALEDPHDDNEEPETFRVMDFILDELAADDIRFENPQYQSMLDVLHDNVDNDDFKLDALVSHDNEQVRSLFVDLIAEPHTLNNWERKEIIVTEEKQRLRRAVMGGIYAYKAKKVERMIKENQQQMKDVQALQGDVTPYIERQMKLDAIKKQIGLALGRAVMH